MTTTTNQLNAMPLKREVHGGSMLQQFSDIFAAFRLLAAADKIEKAEQDRMLRGA